MGIPLKIRLIDEVRCQVTGLTTLDRNLVYKKLTIFVPNAQFMSKYKAGIWDGKIHFFDSNGVTYIGLLSELAKLINIDFYDISVEPYEGYKESPQFGSVDENYFSDFVWEPGHRLEGQPIILEEHQVNGINALLNNHKGMISYATGAGKTIISSALAKKVTEKGRLLIIVPSRDLVINTANQIKYFGIDCGIVGESETRQEDYSKKCVVTTWQGISTMLRRCKGHGYHQDKAKRLNRKQNEAYFNHNQTVYDVLTQQIKEQQEFAMADVKQAQEELEALKAGVIGILLDECHKGSSHEIKTILNEIFPYVQIRWGMTGTIPKVVADKYNLYGSIGPVVGKLTSKELQDKGFLANCYINMIKLQDLRIFANYADENEVLSSDANRLSWIAKYCDLISKKYGNMLILVNRIAEGDILLSEMKALGSDVIFLNGKDTTKKRTEQYAEINYENNKVIIATVQIASTGINIPRLFNLVMIDVGKSFTRVIQSIGRALRLGSDKTYAYVHDISSTTKYSKKHYAERKKYYIEEGHPITEQTVKDWG